MYNLLSTTAHKLASSTCSVYWGQSTSNFKTLYLYKKVGCEKCANFKIVLKAVSPRLKNAPQDFGDAIDMSMCTYTGMFPKLDCVLCKCHKCGVGNLQELIMEGNSMLLRDTSKNVLIKQWVKKQQHRNDQVPNIFWLETCKCFIQWIGWNVVHTNGKHGKACIICKLEFYSFHEL